MLLDFTFWIHYASCETSYDASQIDRHEKQWRHYLNKIFIVLDHLVLSTLKF